jgi:hypothetical protein
VNKINTTIFYPYSMSQVEYRFLDLVKFLPWATPDGSIDIPFLNRQFFLSGETPEYPS